MAKRFLNPLNLLNSATDPVTASSGDFYYNTTLNTVKVYNGTVWTVISGGGGASISVNDNVPVSPTQGALWFESDTGRFFVYYDSFWVELGAPGSQGPAGVAGATGPAGVAGANGTSGTTSVSAPLVNSGTSSSAILSINYDTSLLLSGSQLAVNPLTIPRLSSINTFTNRQVIDGSVQLGLSATASNNWHVTTEANDGTLRFWNGNYGSGTERVRINAGGNMAVNSAVSNVRESGSGQYLTIGGTGAAGAVLELYNTAADAAGNYGTIVFGVAGNSTTPAIKRAIAQVEAYTSGTTATDRGGNILFSTKADGGGMVPRMFIDSNGSLQIKQILENATVSAFALTGTVNYEVIANGAVTYFTGTSVGNWTLNLRGSSTVTLNSMMAVGQTLTLAILATNGATAYYPNVYQIDGVNVTPKWQGGTAITAGNINSIDSYSLTVIKTAATPTYTVLVSQTKFA